MQDAALERELERFAGGKVVRHARVSPTPSP
jgi:hypothetical protein